MKKNRGSSLFVDLAGYGLSRFILKTFYIPWLMRRAYVKTGAAGTAGTAANSREPRQRVLAWLKATVQKYCAEYLPGSDSAGPATAHISHFQTRIADDLIFTHMSVQKQDVFFTNHLTVAGGENLLAALAAERGIVLLGAHFGSVIRAALAAAKTISEAMQAAHKRSLFICSEPVFLKQPGTAGLQAACTRFYGTEIQFINTGTGSIRVIREIIKVLDSRAIVAANMEVVSGGSSQLTFPLFEKAAVKLPALAAACFCAFHSHATLLPWFHVQDKKYGNLLTFETPFFHTGSSYAYNGALLPDYKSLACRLAAILGKWITAYPGQWMYWDRLGRMLG